MDKFCSVRPVKAHFFASPIQFFHYSHHQNHLQWEVCKSDMGQVGCS